MDPTDFERFQNVTRHLLRMVLTAHREIEVLHRLLAAKLPLAESELQAVRERVDRDFGPLIESADRAPSEKLLDILEKFEGPIQ